MNKFEQISMLYALRAGVSQLVCYSQKIESRGDIHRLNSEIDLLLAEQLKNALSRRYAGTIPCKYWRYVDVLICYLQRTEQDLTAALETVRNSNKQATDFMHDQAEGYGLVSDEIGLGCPNYNDEIMRQLQQIVACVKDVHIPDKISAKYADGTMESMILRSLIRSNKPTPELLRMALTKFYDLPNRQMQEYLSKLNCFLTHFKQELPD